MSTITHDYDRDNFEAWLTAVNLMYQKEFSQRIKEGIRRSKERKAKLEQSQSEKKIND